MINKEILYDVEWQILRVSLLGKFVSKDGMKYNLSKLNQYINNAITKQEKFHRLWRVINLLNATRMGFSGMDLYDTPQDKLLLTQRKIWQKEYKEMQNNGYMHDNLNWNKVEKDLMELYDLNINMFQKIKNNLIQRTKQSMKKTGSLDYRNELTKFLNLMKNIEK